MKRIIRITIIVLGSIVLLTNMFPFFSKWNWYYFTTKNGEFYFELFETKGRDLAMMNRRWQIYAETKQPTDTVIYRTFKIDPLKFWEWREYIFSKKYKFPYIRPEDIEKADLKWNDN